MMNSKKVAGAAVAAGLAALAWLNVDQVVRACGVCEIFWDDPDPGCTEATSGGVFSYEVTTRGSSIAKGNWTLVQAVATPVSSNLESPVSVDPATFGVVEIGGIAEINVPTEVEGELDENDEPGISDLSSFDGSGCLDCSGAHRTNVKTSTQNCS